MKDTKVKDLVLLPSATCIFFAAKWPSGLTLTFQDKKLRIWEGSLSSLGASHSFPYFLHTTLKSVEAGANHFSSFCQSES